MTCIVGLIEQGVIYLGGDSISVSSYNKTLNRDSKVFQRNGLLLGTCGHIRLRNLLQYRLDIPPYQGTGPMTYLLNELLVTFVTSEQGTVSGCQRPVRE